MHYLYVYSQLHWVRITGRKSIDFKGCYCGGALILLLVFLSMTGPSAVAAGNDLSTNRRNIDRVQLRLNPKFCTLAKNEFYCAVIIIIYWFIQQKYSLCLNITRQSNVTYYWTQTTSDSIMVQIDGKDDLIVELQKSTFQVLLASETLNIARKTKDYQRKWQQPLNLIHAITEL